jgi:hypothetical protein
MRQLQSITTQGLASSTLPDNQHQETQDLAATQHQHQVINTRTSHIWQKRKTAPGNQHQANQNPAATQHSIRQSTPGKATSGSNAAQHQEINTRQSNIQRSTASGNQQQAK